MTEHTKSVVIRGINLAEVRILKQGDSIVLDLEHKRMLTRLWRILRGRRDADNEFVKVDLENGTWTTRDPRYPL